MIPDVFNFTKLLVVNLCDTYVLNFLIKPWNNFMNAALNNENGLVMSIHFVVLGVGL